MFWELQVATLARASSHKKVQQESKRSQSRGNIDEKLRISKLDYR